MYIYKQSHELGHCDPRSCNLDTIYYFSLNASMMTNVYVNINKNYKMTYWNIFLYKRTYWKHKKMHPIISQPCFCDFCCMIEIIVTITHSNPSKQTNRGESKVGPTLNV